MKKRIFISLCITSVLAVLLAGVLLLFTFYSTLTNQVKEDVRTAADMLQRTLSLAEIEEESDFAEISKSMHGMRITVIAADGDVVYDSDADEGNMENHADRPEIEDALQNGSGESMRGSATLGGMQTYYYAVRLESGGVLRLSQRTSSISAVFFSNLPIVAGILVAVVIICVFTSSKLSKRILSPIDTLTDRLYAAPDDEPIPEEENPQYEELAPFYHKIKVQNELIRYQIGKLKSERDTIRQITENMKEGLIILDENRSILSVNKSALDYLHASGNFIQKNILTLSRNLTLSDMIGKALAGEADDFILHDGDSFYHIFVNPAEAPDTPRGVIIMILDVTQQQKAELVRREFSANVSHELKTPLTSISGFAEMIEKDMVSSEEEIKYFATRILKESVRLQRLIDDIIRLSQIEEQQDVHAFSQVDLYKECESVIASMQFAAQQNQVTLSLDGDHLNAQANPHMMEELVYNLCENAVKYNRPGGAVHVSLRKEGENAVLSVSDTGIGIPKEHHDRIFERFYRVDKSRSKQTGGTGLGLSIVKHIVEYHGGTIALQSDVDKGTTITVTLPLRQPQPPQES